ncbi:MAG: hypothetical protein AB1656_16975 [Candidatus Omnitrophota bacterium]
MAGKRDCVPEEWVRRRLASWPVWAVARFLSAMERIQRQTHYGPDDAAAVAVESIGAAVESSQGKPAGKPFPCHRAQDSREADESYD